MIRSYCCKAIIMITERMIFNQVVATVVLVLFMLLLMKEEAKMGPLRLVSVFLLRHLAFHHVQSSERRYQRAKKKAAVSILTILAGPW